MIKSSGITGCDENDDNDESKFESVVVKSVVVESVVESDENPLMRIWSAIGELGTSRVRVGSVRSVKSVREEGSEREVAAVSDEGDGI